LTGAKGDKGDQGQKGDKGDRGDTGKQACSWLKYHSTMKSTIFRVYRVLKESQVRKVFKAKQVL